MIVNQNDMKQTSTGIIGVGAQILNKQSFDQEAVNLVLGLLSKRRHIYKKNIVALDCGANIGVHTIEWARHMHGSGQVHAYEAQERIYYALAGNIAINNCSNARATWAAVGAKPGFLNVPRSITTNRQAMAASSFANRRRTKISARPSATTNQTPMKCP